MTLSEHEQRVFQEIEQRFGAERDATSCRGSGSRQPALVLAGCWVVGVLSLMALLTGSLLVVAVAVIVAAATVWHPLFGRNRAGR